ncbi:hypothetical protein K440DRAFT_637626 [Wilcoxina mikolae CBS 423.85]|nr:hypothetical protein K440DRAFT_637626 [Wilcoxina mikolae CBS 423.85]
MAELNFLFTLTVILGVMTILTQSIPCISTVLECIHEVRKMYRQYINILLIVLKYFLDLASIFYNYLVMSGNSTRLQGTFQKQFLHLAFVSNATQSKIPNMMDDDIGLCFCDSIDPAPGQLQVDSALRFVLINFGTIICGSMPLAIVIAMQQIAMVWMNMVIRMQKRCVLRSSGMSMAMSAMSWRLNFDNHERYPLPQIGIGDVTTAMLEATKRDLDISVSEINTFRYRLTEDVLWTV